MIKLPALARSYSLYEATLIHRRPPWKTKEAVELATLEWVSWFNNHRLLEPIGYIPPAEAEANYDRQLASQAPPVEAGLNPASLRVLRGGSVFALVPLRRGGERVSPVQRFRCGFAHLCTPDQFLTSSE